LLCKQEQIGERARRSGSATNSGIEGGAGYFQAWDTRAAPQLSIIWLAILSNAYRFNAVEAGCSLQDVGHVRLEVLRHRWDLML
jgi:hypothetical protein